MLKRQQNESPYSKSVTVTERLLLVWCLKDNRMNRLAVKVWQLMRGFFFGLMFRRQQNELAYGKSVTVNERVLLVCCLKENRMNRL